MRKIQSLVPSTFPFYGKDRTCLLRTRVATKEGCPVFPGFEVKNGGICSVRVSCK